MTTQQDLRHSVTRWLMKATKGPHEDFIPSCWDVIDIVHSRTICEVHLQYTGHLRNWNVEKAKVLAFAGNGFLWSYQIEQGKPNEEKKTVVVRFKTTIVEKTQMVRLWSAYQTGGGVAQPSGVGVSTSPTPAAPLLAEPLAADWGDEYRLASQMPSTPVVLPKTVVEQLLGCTLGDTPGWAKVNMRSDGVLLLRIRLHPPTAQEKTRLVKEIDDGVLNRGGLFKFPTASMVHEDQIWLECTVPSLLFNEVMVRSAQLDHKELFSRVGVLSPEGTPVSTAFLEKVFETKLDTFSFESTLIKEISGGSGISKIELRSPSSSEKDRKGMCSILRKFSKANLKQAAQPWAVFSDENGWSGFIYLPQDHIGKVEIQIKMGLDNFRPVKVDSRLLSALLRLPLSDLNSEAEATPESDLKWHISFTVSGNVEQVTALSEKVKDRVQSSSLRGGTLVGKFCVDPHLFRGLRNAYKEAGRVDKTQVFVAYLGDWVEEDTPGEKEAREKTIASDLEKLTRVPSQGKVSPKPVPSKDPREEKKVEKNRIELLEIDPDLPGEKEQREKEIAKVLAASARGKKKVTIIQEAYPPVIEEVEMEDAGRFNLLEVD